MTADVARPGEPVAQSARPGRVPGTPRLELLGEVLLTGALVAVLSVPVVTAVPALAAGARHLRRHAEGYPDPARVVVGDAVRAVRDWWALGVGVPALVALLALDLWLAGTGALPGGAAVAVVAGLAGVAALVVVLRAAAAWEPGTRPVPALRAAGRASAGDLGGSALLVAALAVCGVLVWMLLPLVLVVGGLLALAAVAVELRARRPVAA